MNVTEAFAKFLRDLKHWKASEDEVMRLLKAFEAGAHFSLDEAARRLTPASAEDRQQAMTVKYCKCEFTDSDGTIVPGEACSIHSSDEARRHLDLAKKYDRQAALGLSAARSYAAFHRKAARSMTRPGGEPGTQLTVSTAQAPIDQRARQIDACGESPHMHQWLRPDNGTIECATCGATRNHYGESI